jgi:L-ribulose-5-phosphate 3-epimerase
MKLTNQIGIMQGRLSPRIDGKIQAYPARTWQKEFNAARKIGYSAIEWIVEKPTEINALMSDTGIEEINNIISKTGVRIDFICADIFMQQPLVRMTTDIMKENAKNLIIILMNAKKVGAIGVEIPFVDASSIKTDSEKSELILFMQDAFNFAKEIGLRISFETDLAPTSFKEFLECIKLDHVHANYDIGNSASLGFNPIEEINAYGNKILNVHVKDRVLGGSTVSFGSGSSDFKLVFSKLNEINYSGGITIQGARGRNDIEVAKSQLLYVQEIMKQI